MNTLFAIIFSLLMSCGGNAGDCADNSSCAFGESCVEGVCQGSSCNTSLQCKIEQYCGSERTCVAGCESSSDCYYGSTCLDGECVEDGCTETKVDCGYREFCNTAEGSCYDAGDLYCRPCGEDSECGDGNICWAGHCGVDCTYNECPAGFDCYSLTNSAGSVTGYQCLTYCWLFEDYEPGAFVKGGGDGSAGAPQDPNSGLTAAPVKESK